MRFSVWFKISCKMFAVGVCRDAARKPQSRHAGVPPNAGAVLDECVHHTLRRNELGVVVTDGLHLRDLLDAVDRGSADPAHALGQHVDRTKKRFRLFVEKEVIVTKNGNRSRASDSSSFLRTERRRQQSADLRIPRSPRLRRVFRSVGVTSAVWDDMNFVVVVIELLLKLLLNRDASLSTQRVLPRQPATDKSETSPWPTWPLTRVPQALRTGAWLLERSPASWVPA